MTIEHWPHSTDSPPFITFESRERRTVASYKRRLKALRRTENAGESFRPDDTSMLVISVGAEGPHVNINYAERRAVR